MSRTALVTNVVAHYRVPCLRALAARLNGQIDYFVLSEGMAHRQYVQAGEGGGLTVTTLTGRGFVRPPFDHAHLNDIRPLSRGYGLYVLGGWSEPTYLMLWALARSKGARVAFWLESTQSDMARSSRKEGLKRQLLRGAAGVIAAGTRAAEYAEALGVPRTRIYCAPNAVDTEYFGGKARELLPRRAELRAELGIRGVCVLFVGRMVEQFKSVATLLAAQTRLQREGVGTELILIGEGPDRARYEQVVEQQGLHARFVNFLPHEDLCHYYAAADVFVLPSRSEPWGFVLNEAMEFGAPLVVSDAVGAGADLVKAGENGWVFPRGDAAALARRLGELASDEGLRARMGAASKRIVAAHTPASWAEGFAHGVEQMRAVEPTRG